MDGMHNLRGDPESRSMTKVFVMLAVFIFFTFSSRYQQRQKHHGLTISEKINSWTSDMNLRDITSLIQYDEEYTGSWAGGGELGLT